MRIVNSYIEGSLICVDTYKATPKTLGALFESDTARRENVEKSDIKLSEIKGKQLVARSDLSYMVRRYFHSGDTLVVLTGASRNGETAEIRRFLESFAYDKNIGPTGNSQITAISDLRMTDVTVNMDLVAVPVTKGRKPANPQPQSTPTPVKEDDPNRILLLYKPRAAYTDAARTKNVQGTIRLKITFSDDGSIPQITVKTGLPEGLLRQTLISAVRIKFLPKLKDGNAVTSENTLEYNFAIY
jgi:hypothetical protein